ncbi:MAG: sterol desaturase family protein [Gammaproteobacteria bacterium]
MPPNPIKEPELNSNFGSFLPWWDRLFHTYNAQPESGHRNMRIACSASAKNELPGFGDCCHSRSSTRNS